GQHLLWTGIDVGASHHDWARRVHSLGQRCDAQCLAIKWRKQRCNANHVGMRLADALANLVPRQAIVAIMAEQLEGTDIPRLVVGLEIGKFWRQLQYVPVHGRLTVENLDLDPSAAQRGSQIQQAYGQCPQCGLIEIFYGRLDEEDFHSYRVQRLWYPSLSVYY